MFAKCDLVYRYTRANAIADGVLVDVSEYAPSAGFTIPVAMTAAVFNDCCAWSESAPNFAKVHQDLKWRIHDVLFMARLSICIHLEKESNSNSVNYSLFVVPPNGDSVEPIEVELKILVHAGDELEPVMTIMYRNED